MTTQKRAERVESILTRAIATFLLKKANRDILITVARVVCNHSGRIVRVYCTVYPESKVPQAAQFLQRQENACTMYIKKNVPLRTIPTVRFVTQRQTGTVAKW